MRPLLFIALAGCAEMVSFDEPIPLDDTFDRVPATGQQLARIERAAAYSEKHRGRAFLVLQGDTIVYESGQNGVALETPHHLYSGTKSFTCALYEVARARGVDGEDAVADAIPSMPAGLKVDHLLHLTGGMAQDPRRLSWDAMRAEPRVEDAYALTLEQPFRHPPGKVFEYGSAHFNLFGELVTRELGDPLALLEESVFGPIGLRTAGWLRDPAGNPMLALGAWTTVNEWAKYGALVRDDGLFKGERVLPPGLHDCLVGSDANPAYGRTFWLNKDVPDGVALVAESRLESDGPIISNQAPDDLVAAAGHNDQRLYIIPSKDLVIVRLGDGGWGFTDRELLAPFFD